MTWLLGMVSIPFQSHCNKILSKLNKFLFQSIEIKVYLIHCIEQNHYQTNLVIYNYNLLNNPKLDEYSCSCICGGLEVSTHTGDSTNIPPSGTRSLFFARFLPLFWSMRSSPDSAQDLGKGGMLKHPPFPVSQPWPQLSRWGCGRGGWVLGGGGLVCKVGGWIKHGIFWDYLCWWNRHCRVMFK